MESPTFPRFSTLPANARRIIWTHYYHNFYHGARIHVIQAVDHTSDPDLPMDVILFRKTATVDADSGNRVTNLRLVFPCREARGLYTWLLNEKPWIVTEFRRAVDLTMGM